MSDSDDAFNKLKEEFLRYDPVAFCEKYLTLDGKPFRIRNNGYKPFGDIYRYIGVKALEPGAKPVIMVKGRQVGGTTMAGALEMYFMGSGLFGTATKPPIRVIHTFPQLELAAAYSKTKLNAMISSSIPSDAPVSKGGKTKSFMQNLLDTSSATNDSLHFKQFLGGNHIWIESTGLDADRIMGRMLSLETDIPTPTGFVKLKDLKEGDDLFDENGNICQVTKLHPIDMTPDSYKVTFDDGSIVDACGDHLWLTYTKSNRSKGTKALVKNTKEILNSLMIGKERNHSIPTTLPINYPKQDLPLDPYLLGLWLGDGSRYGNIESADPEIFQNYQHHIIPSSIGRISSFSNGKPSKSSSYRVDGLTTALSKLNQLQNSHSGKGDFYNKHIPDIYMRSSFEDRLSLLQGLLDTDGHCDKNGHIEFAQVREDLANQVHQLTLSLGIKSTIVRRDSWRYDVKYKDKFRVRFTTHLPVFRMARKLERVKQNKKILAKASHRFIANVEPIAPVPMRCITVNSPSHLYLVTKSFIPTHNTADVLIFDEIQKTSGHAIGNALKILTTAKYGRPTKGVQVFFGTPRRKGSDYHKMWQASSQQYYHLGCEGCKELFPLYTAGSDDWEKIWIHTVIVKCPKCGFEQNKLEAAERGKWVASRDPDDPDCLMVGFHINQLYMPGFTKEDLMGEKPGVHPINTERTYQNEVLGEFFQGDSSPMTPEEIAENCADIGRKFSARIEHSDNDLIFLGIDYGARADAEQLAKPESNKGGQSYSTAVVLKAKGAGVLSIEFATKFKRNDPESKKGIIDQIMRQYNIKLAVGDIGYSNDFSVTLANIYGEKYLVSRASGKLNNHTKFNQDLMPKEILFERDYYIAELYEKMKKGLIRFPFGDYDKIGWLIEHCTSMEIKPSISQNLDPVLHYVKSGSPNDGFMALLNAYIAYKFMLTKGFSSMNPMFQNENINDAKAPMIFTGVVRRKF